MSLEPYSTYKETGVLYLANIPSHWDVKKIAHYFYAKKGVNAAQLTKEYCNTIPGEYPVYSGQTENNGVMSFIDGFEFDFGERGCLFSTTVGAKAMTVMHLRGQFSLSQNCLTVIPKSESIFVRYFYYSFQPLFAFERGLIPEHMQASFRMEDLYRYRVSDPPLLEQVAIANFLDRETSKLDTLISKQEKLIEIIKERIIATVLGAINSIDTKFIRLLYVCDIISRPVHQEEGSIFTRLGVLNRGRGLFKREDADSEDMGESDFFWVKSGDLILSGQFAWEGSVAIADEEHEGCVVSHRFPIIRGKSGVVLTEYLLALFMTTHGDFLLNENSRGSAGRNRPLNMSLLLKEKIPIASISVQNEVARLLRLQKKLKDKVQTQNNLLKEHRTALISAAVTGKIDVREVA